MRIWDGMKVQTKHGYTGVVEGEARPGYVTGRPVVVLVVLDKSYATFQAGDKIRYLTSEVRVTGRAR